MKSRLVTAVIVLACFTPKLTLKTQKPLWQGCSKVYFFVCYAYLCIVMYSIMWYNINPRQIYGGAYEP